MSIYVINLCGFDHHPKPVIMYHVMFIDVFFLYQLWLNHNEKSICDVGTHWTSQHGKIAWRFVFPCHHHPMGFSLACPGLLARPNAFTSTIIPSSVDNSQTHIYQNRFEHAILWKAICRQNTLMFALVFWFELCARAARMCCHCHLVVKNLIHDDKRGV